MAKTALVLCGGGSRAAFAVGVLKYIYSQPSPQQFDIFCGTGTSAIVTSLAALGEINLLEKLFTLNRTADLINTGNLLQRFPGSNSLYNNTAFIQKLNNIFTEARFDALKKTEKEIFIAALSLQTNQITYFSPNVPPSKDVFNIQRTEEVNLFREAVLGACSNPVFMPPVEVKVPGVFAQQYFTAGGELYSPIRLAIARGATSIYVIQLSPDLNINKSIYYKDVVDLLERQIDQDTLALNPADISLVHAQNTTLQYLEQVKNNLLNSGMSPEAVEQAFETDNNPFKNKQVIDLHIIKPEKALPAPMGGLEFDPGTMKELLEIGQQTAEKKWARE
ncbi:Patatin-like phospholipase [Chitinophaga terrae (ex Kim and Jung 2007)]|uniref:Patatin-like phospholipase n=1 Tax=Chitinophaga terrae (ex Kim and Jung 2007) TaxID=408074 RepID=A0A1H4DDC5_9BACT|nr:patatin-like phospholipase family protein [Chitinophaga terrae (ex Kim and Jung 2007)]GEP92566.1 hypothetical protein CTE07_42110 [Chitinophaga terrae (ex Kim and Jung 2007)]SEA70578.1 Patatin-like phospholipase [Chitinophaga terrae (ex Kim and Jung 2007)]